MAENKYFQKHTFLAIAFYVFIVFLTAITIYYRHKESIYRHLDQHLAASAASVQYLLADDFHDRAIAKDSVLPAEDQENIRLLTQMARLSSVTYLYTVIIKNQHIFITSSSASEEEMASSSEVRYFTRYDEAVHLLTDKIKKDEPIQLTYSDRWGTFRTSLLLRSSPAGNSYISGAEININDISAGLRMEMLLAFGYSFLLLGATIPLHLIYSARLRKHSASLKVANNKLIEEQKINTSLGAELLQAQKMEAIGTLAGGIAHDFNNILSVIIGYAEMAEQDSTAGSMAKNDIKQVLKASNRAKDLVKRILSFSRHTDTEPVVVQVAAVIHETIKLLRSSLPSTIAIREDVDPESGYILADPTQIHQILMNLCTNAFHAMEETGGILSISLRKKYLQCSDFPSESNIQPGDFLELSIADTGSGIAPEIQKKIFDPYFTTKEVGKGTGMGLAIIHGIVKSYGGFVTFESQAGEGTVFHAYFPAMADAALPGTDVPDIIPVGHEHILFIDDEEILAEMGKQLLERLGYRVTVRLNSIDALSTFQSQPERFDLIITDQTMPDMTGFDLAKRILQLRPGMPIILCTGYSSQVSKDKAKSYGIRGFALKPLTKKDIAVLIRKVLDA